MNPALRIQVLVGLMSLAMLGYLILLSRTGIALISSGKPAAIGLGAAVLIFPIVGGWALFATLRAGFAHQRLAREAVEQGMELDISELPRMRSGRVQRDAADALFETVRAELEADRDNWVRWYRLARAYDYAGDRRRAREAMGKAVTMHAAQSK